MKKEYRLVINGLSSNWTKSSPGEIMKLIAIYNKQDRAAGRPAAKYAIETITIEEIEEAAE
jgi:hypothetical protein